MPSEPGHAAPPPSIFISYASADRPQARLLGAVLEKAGLDVWFDEEELAGGDAWDAKIRQQIRTCTYFMPVISATTEARREGYFRREWRLAVERTLDLADDVMFLVPVVIDDTPEYHARVPEKFTTVQWLRCPGGKETTQLNALARRLVHGHTPTPASPPTAPARAAVPPPLAPRRSENDKEEHQAAVDAARYPFPAFPEFPAHGHRGRFVYDLIVWAGHLLRALWMRLPRWLRLVAMVVIVFKAINGVFNINTSTTSEDEPPRPKVSAPARIKKSLEDDPEARALAGKILSATSAALDTFQSGRPVALVRFATVGSAAEEPANEAFTALENLLAVDGHEKQIAAAAIPLAANYTDQDALARAAVLKCRWLLAGVAEPAGSGNFSLTINLYDVAAGKVVYHARRTADDDEAAKIGRELAIEVRKHLTFDDPAASPAPATTPPPATPEPAAK